MWHDADGMGWWMVWGSVMMVLFWGGFIALIVWAIQSLTRRDAGEAGGSGPNVRSPLDIARERYASGEISREQFEEIKRTLQT